MDRKQTFGEEVFAEPSLTTGHREHSDQRGLARCLVQGVTLIPTALPLSGVRRPSPAGPPSEFSSQ